MEGLVDILLKQWFNRIWVMQEVALATKEPVMLVGRAWCYPQALRYLCDAIFSDPRMNATVHCRDNIGILISFDSYSQFVTCYAQATHRYIYSFFPALRALLFLTIIPIYTHIYPHSPFRPWHNSTALSRKNRRL
jgi:hypothetical protein